MSHLDIQLLGDFQLTHNGRSLNDLNSNRLQTLLVYLLLHRSAPQPRRHIAFLFWPDTSEKQALTNLRTIYTRLRKKLPDADLFLQSDSQTMQWRSDAPYTLDVAAFETAVTHAHTTTDWQTAVSLYHGPLLPGWYEEWLEPERQRLQQAFLQANETLLHLLEAQRRYPDAIHTAQNHLRHDPLHEATYRRLMRVQALNGEKADALRTYHTCATLLENELGVTPDEATRALYEQLLHAGLEPEPSPTSQPETAVIPLIGRDDEWNQLKRAWQTAVRGRARLVLISGEAGIGKSRLAAELQQWAQRQGIDTAATRSYQAEGELTYAPLLTWLRTPILQSAWQKADDVVLTELARLLPELLVKRLDLAAPAPLTQSWQRQRLFAALTEAVLARSRPLLLHIDDLQWCDAETLQWLHFLLRTHPQAPLLIVGTFRSEEIRREHPLIPLQLALRQSRQLKEIELAPLPAAETAVLAAHLTPQPINPAETNRLFQETEGNPLFIIEMMRPGLPQAHSLPPTIQAMIQARFAQLSSQARELMAQAAVIGRAFDYALLAQTSGMAEDVLVTHLDELWRRRLIREHGGADYDFSHDKIREVAYAELSQARQRLLHRRVAQSLEALHPANIAAYSSQIAAHYEAADQPAAAIPHYQRAANTARQLYAHAEAITHLQRALQLLPQLPENTPLVWRRETTAQLYESLGDLLHFTAQYEAAQTAYEGALTAVTTTPAPPIWHGRLHRKIGSACLAHHQYTTALHQFDQAKTALGTAPTSPENSWWQEWLALQQERKYLFYWLNRWPEIAEILEESRPVLAQYGTAEQRALFLDPTLYLRRDSFVISDEVLAISREWLAANLELDDPVRHASAHFSMGFILLWSGDFAKAETEMQTALAMTSDTGDVNLRARCLTYLTILYRQQDRLDHVQTFAAQSMAAATEAAMSEYVATSTANLAWVAWREGNVDQALQNGRQALTIWHTLPSGHASCAFQWTALFPLMAAALATGQLDEAAAHAQALLDPTQQKLPEALTAVLTQVIAAPDSQKAAHLTQAITLARQMHYL